MGGGPGLAKRPTAGGASYIRSGGLGSSVTVALLFLFFVELMDALDVALIVLIWLKTLEMLVSDRVSSLGGLVGDVVSEIVVVAVIPWRSPSPGLLLTLEIERGESGANGIPTLSREDTSSH